MVHPQKRMDIKMALEAVMGRVLEVKELLIELNKKVARAVPASSSPWARRPAACQLHARTAATARAPASDPPLVLKTAGRLHQFGRRAR